MQRKKIISGALMFSLMLLLLVNSSIAYAELTPPLPGAPNYVDTGVEKVHEMLEENSEQIILLDVRTEGEYEVENILGAINIPLSDLENRIDELDMSKVIVYCQSGGRSKTASGILAQHGFVVYNMRGGINAWKEKFATTTATPTPMPAQTPVPTLSPTVTPSPAASPSPGIPGFEAPLAIMVLLIVFTLRRKRK
jgi:rhodanese-related sulfurtransferase